MVSWSQCRASTYANPPITDPKVLALSCLVWLFGYSSQRVSRYGRAMSASGAFLAGNYLMRGFSKALTGSAMSAPIAPTGIYSADRSYHPIDINGGMP